MSLPKFATRLALFAMGLLVLFGYDRALAAMLVSAMPDWLLELTTKY